MKARGWQSADEYLSWEQGMEKRAQMAVDAFYGQGKPASRLTLVAGLALVAIASAGLFWLLGGPA